MHLSLRTTQYLSFSSSFHSLLADSDVDCVSTALGHEMYLQLGSHTGALCESVWPRRLRDLVLFYKCNGCD